MRKARPTHQEKVKSTPIAIKFFYFIRETGGRNQSEVYWFRRYVDNLFTGSLLYECELVCSLRTILHDQLFERIFQFQHILRYDSKGKNFTRLVNSIY